MALYRYKIYQKSDNISNFKIMIKKSFSIDLMMIYMEFALPINR